MAKFDLSGWLDIGLYCVFMYREEVEVRKYAEK